MKKIKYFAQLFLLIITICFPLTNFYAQEVILLPKEDLKMLTKDSKNVKVLNTKEMNAGSKYDKNLSGQFSNANNSLNFIDTLFTISDPYNPNSYGSNFGFFGQDYMVQWFQAPADLYLREVGFSFYSAYVPVADLEMKVIACTFPIDSLQYLNNELWGYYLIGDSCLPAAALPDNSGCGWSSFNGHLEPIGEDIWSDGGVGYTFTPITDSIEIIYQFIDLGVLGYPEIPAGTIFGVVLKNKAPIGSSRVGLNGTFVGTGGQYQNSLFKYYAFENSPGNDIGWWSRDVTLGFAAVVDIYFIHNEPQILGFTQILSGSGLGPFTIEANIIDPNISESIEEIISAKIQWSIDNGTNWNDVPMTYIGSDLWSGDIPAQPENTEVTYRISATDENNNTTISSSVSFYTFVPSGVPNLIIFNGFTDPTGYPQDFYFGSNTEFDHDIWAYGKISEIDIFNNYTNIFEIWNETVGTYNDSLVALWLAGASNRNYYLAGQEWLGWKNGFVDSDYVAGDFEYDVLGITHSYNEVSFNGTGGETFPTLVMPEAGSLFGQLLLDLFNSLTPPADSMMYNPMFITGNSNWQDAYDVLSDVTVDMMIETRGIQGVPVVDTLPTMSHRILPAGNKIVFASHDPISLSTALDSTYSYYYLVGHDTSNSVYQALKWFGILTDVKETNSATPIEFSLAQNYPNPFNPSTKIKFSIPQISKVTLKVYDILGNEVVTLINEIKNVGNYEVDFKASLLSSGVYFYQLKAGNYIETKKMILMK